MPGLNYISNPYQGVLEAGVPSGIQAALQQAANTSLARQQMEWQMRQGMAAQAMEAQRLQMEKERMMQELDIHRQNLEITKSYRDAYSEAQRGEAQKRRAEALGTREKYYRGRAADVARGVYGRRQTTGTQENLIAMDPEYGKQIGTEEATWSRDLSELRRGRASAQQYSPDQLPYWDNLIQQHMATHPRISRRMAPPAKRVGVTANLLGDTREQDAVLALPDDVIVVSPNGQQQYARDVKQMVAAHRAKMTTTAPPTTALAGVLGSISQEPQQPTDPWSQEMAMPLPNPRTMGRDKWDQFVNLYRQQIQARSSPQPFQTPSNMWGY